jgi:5-methyltetrahydropteroyltriglutamate--homocysteine methyltransferase
MQRSTDRFLTTHTGSLPRPDDLIKMMYAKEEGVPVEAQALAQRVGDAVAEVVHKQAAAGVDIINDGEMSKPSYATYIKDRLSGFGGADNSFVYRPGRFPRPGQACVRRPRPLAPQNATCNAAVQVRDPKRRKPTWRILQAALARSRRARGLSHRRLTRRGVAVLPQRALRHEEQYLFAIADAMRQMLRPSPRRASWCRSTAQTSAWAATSQHADCQASPNGARKHSCIEALNHALANIAPIGCACSAGRQLRGAAPLRRAAGRRDRHRAARAQCDFAGGVEPRHAHEWKLFEVVKLPRAAARSRRHRVEVELHRAPRAGGAAHRPLCQLVGRENVIAGSGCGFGTWVEPGGSRPDVV